MPYLYSDEQEQIRSEVRKVLDATCTTDTLRTLIEREGAFDQAYWQAAQDMGWTAMGIPDEHGGLGMTLFDTLIVAEETGRVLAGAPFLATNFAAADLVPESIAAGPVVLAFAEGTEILPPRIAVQLSPENCLIGEKIAVLGGAGANFAIVLCTDSAKTSQLVLVDLRAPSVFRDSFTTIDNSRCTATLRFNRTPATLLPTSDAMKTARDCLARLALHLAAEAVGGTDACIARARDYANQRQAFGQAIGKFQAVKHAIAEMYVANEMARASILDAAVRLGNNDADAEVYVAAAYLNGTQAYELAATGATQIHGGIGVTWEADLHLHYRRSRSLATEAGPPHYWEDRIAAILEAA